MNHEYYFEAPWGRTLKLVSALASLVLIGAAVALLLAPDVPGWTRVLVTAITLGMLLISGLYTVRAYELDRAQVLVHRLLWKTRIPLDHLRSVEADPDAIRNSIRLFGNGGLFSFSGWFRNRRLGTYRLCATNPRNAVVLRFPDKTWVISPARTQDFIRAVRERTGLP